MNSLSLSLCQPFCYLQSPVLPFAKVSSNSLNFEASRLQVQVVVTNVVRFSCTSLATPRKLPLERDIQTLFHWNFNQFGRRLSVPLNGLVSKWLLLSLLFREVQFVCSSMSSGFQYAASYDSVVATGELPRGFPWHASLQVSAIGGGSGAAHLHLRDETLHSYF